MGKNNLAELEAIRRLESQAEAAWEAGDVNTFLNLFTDDVVWMPPGAADVVGKDACREMTRGLLGNTDFEQVTSTNEETILAGEWAFHRFHGSMVATPKAGGEAGQMSLRGFHLLRKMDDGSWKIARYIWN